MLGLRTVLWLLAIMIPVSGLVVFLRETGLLSLLAETVEPLFGRIGLPGEASLPFVTGLLVNLYSLIAASPGIGLDLRSMTILALMGLTAHNLLVELPVLRSTGSGVFRMLVLRIGSAFLIALMLNVVVPADFGERVPAFSLAVLEGSRGSVGLLGWLLDSLMLSARVAAILVPLMIVETLLRRYGVSERMGRAISPLMRIFGLQASSGVPWVVANTLGLAYGAGVLRSMVSEGTLTLREGDLLNHHIAISHSLLEDTLLFAVLGVPVLWLVVPRLAFAIGAVWLRRLELALRERGAPTG